MADILPGEAKLWQRVEAAARRVFELYGFREIRVPLLEPTELFARSIGETTDIVEKEMYTFSVGTSGPYTLRPEATAGVVRSYIQHRLHLDPAARKLYTLGPMFRHERPQKGRYRQFHQVNAEMFGYPGPRADGELIVMLMSLLGELEVPDARLHLNTLGCPECRPDFKEELARFLKARAKELCKDCRRRAKSNPLRVFDCKKETCQAILKGAPTVLDMMCPGCRDHFEGVKSILEKAGIGYRLDPYLVRGLDYYTRTAFEVKTDMLGAQDALGGGGRYDLLVKELGGPSTPAVGFALGVERLILLLKKAVKEEAPGLSVYLALLGDDAWDAGFELARGLRREGIDCEVPLDARSLKSQLRYADKLGARYVFILGEEELSRGAGTLKEMATGLQEDVRVEDLVDFIKKRL